MQGLKITIISGQTVNDKKEFFFDASHSYIVLGCDESMCHIVFKEDLRDRGIGNEHLAFKRSLGRYQLDLNTDHYVEVNGKPPIEELEIKGQYHFKLGDGVLLQVEVIDRRPKAKTVGKPMIQAGSLARKNKTRYMAVVGLIALMTIGLMWIFQSMTSVQDSVEDVSGHIVSTSDDLKGLQQKIVHLQKDQQDISQAIIDKISESVYLILVQDTSGGETPTGTAWVTENQLLATNAHVAQAFYELKPGERLVARSSKPPHYTHEIRSSRLHPAFKQYEQLWQNYLPVQRSNGELELMETVTPADVAVLELVSIENLGPALPLASQDELKSLAPGSKVGYVGYPSERLLPGSLKSPSPVTQQDELVRITDFFMVNQTDSPNRLIQHGLPITGGASGSPMFTSDGKVIGLICAGNVMMSFGGRMMNSVDINFSQRVDFLWDLLEHKEEVATLSYLQQWQKSLSQFAPARESSLQSVTNHVKKVFSVGEADTLTQDKSVLEIATPGKEHSLNQTHSMHLPHGGVHFVSLTAPKLMPISLSMKPVLDQNVSQFTHPIPYGNFSTYLIILTQEAADIELDMAFQAFGNVKSKESYTIEVNSWEQPLDKAAKAYAHAWFQANTKHESGLKLIKQGQDIALSSENEFGFSQIAGLELTLDKAGWYVFLIIPKDQGTVNAWITDENENFINSDSSPNAISLVHYSKTTSTPQPVTFASIFDDKETVQDMLVFYAPFEP